MSRSMGRLNELVARAVERVDLAGETGLWKEWRLTMGVKSIRENLYKIDINVDISVLMAVLKSGVFGHL